VKSPHKGFLPSKLYIVTALLSISPVNCRYSILVLSLILSLVSFLVLGSRLFAEGFAAFWSGVMLVGLCIGGTMIMRRFHNSMAVGFFMGSVVATSQMFFLLFLVHANTIPYRSDRQVVFLEFLSGSHCSCLLAGTLDTRLTTFVIGRNPKTMHSRSLGCPCSPSHKQYCWEALRTFMLHTYLKFLKNQELP